MGSQVMRSVTLELAENAAVVHDIDLSGGSTVIVRLDGIPPGATPSAVYALRGEVDIPEPTQAFFQGFQTVLVSAAEVTADTAELGGLEPGTYTIMGVASGQVAATGPVLITSVTSTVITIEREGQEITVQLSF